MSLKPRITTAISLAVYACAAALLLIGPAPAGAAGSSQIIRDCIDGVLDGNYSQGDLNRAIKDIPDDVAEYTSCLDAIDDARLGSKKGGGNKLAQLGVDESQPIAHGKRGRKALKSAVKKGGERIDIGGERVIPGTASLLSGGDFIADLPVPVAILVALIGLSMITATCAYAYRRRGRLGGIGRLFKRHR